jgi:hypothetical protein
VTWTRPTFHDLVAASRQEECHDVRGWERGGQERLPPGYRMDTTDAAVWILRRPDGTVAGYFGAWGASRTAVERAARDDHRRRVRHATRA